MTPRRLAPLVLVLVALASVFAHDSEEARAKSNPPRILGGPGIERELWIPYRLDQLDGAITPVAAPGDRETEPVEVWSTAWHPLLDWPQETTIPFEALIGRYYPERGLLAVDARTEEAWFTLDGELREVLDRYVRLARAGELPERPSRLAGDLAAWRLLGEPHAWRVEIAGRPLVGPEANTFWLLVSESEEGELPSSDARRSIVDSRYVPLVLCSGDDICVGWHFFVGHNFLARVVSGFPSWPGFEATPELRQFILDRAGSPDGPPESAGAGGVASRSPRDRLLIAGVAALMATGLGATALIARR